MTCCGVRDDGMPAVAYRDESANAATPADRHVIKATAAGAMAGQVRVLLEPVSAVCMVTAPGPSRNTAADCGAGRCAQASVTARPGRLIVPGGQYHVMISTVSRPARTAGSASASCRDRSSEPVR